jgi:hypothetical protein
VNEQKGSVTGLLILPQLIDAEPEKKPHKQAIGLCRAGKLSSKESASSLNLTFSDEIRAI